MIKHRLIRLCIIGSCLSVACNKSNISEPATLRLEKITLRSSSLSGDSYQYLFKHDAEGRVSGINLLGLNGSGPVYNYYTISYMGNQALTRYSAQNTLLSIDRLNYADTVVLAQSGPILARSWQSDYTQRDADTISRMITSQVQYIYGAGGFCEGQVRTEQLRAMVKNPGNENHFIQLDTTETNIKATNGNIKSINRDIRGLAIDSTKGGAVSRSAVRRAETVSYENGSSIPMPPPLPNEWQYRKFYPLDEHLFGISARYQNLPERETRTTTWFNPDGSVLSTYTDVRTFQYTFTPSGHMSSVRITSGTSWGEFIFEYSGN